MVIKKLFSARLEAENWRQMIESWILKAFERIALGKKQVKASIAWDHPCFLFIFNILNSYACVYLVTTKDILAFVSCTLTPMRLIHWVVMLVLKINNCHTYLTTKWSAYSYVCLEINHT
jgi:hypothetical protein